MIRACASLPVILMLLAGPALAGPQVRGTFTVFAGGRRAGTEIFGSSLVEGEVTVTSRATLSRDGRLQVLALSVRLDAETGGLRGLVAKGTQGDLVKEYRLEARDGRLVGRVREGEEVRELDLALPDGAVVIAEPFFAPWLLVLDRLPATSRTLSEAVELPAVFPFRERVGTVRLEPGAEQGLEIDGKAILARRIHARPSDGEAANLWIDADGRLQVCALSVLGLSALRGDRVKIGLDPGEDPPDPEGVVSRRVRIATGSGTLGATMMFPVEGGPPWPAVLLISGSGPHDRNGNVPRAELQWNLLHSFSVALARRGFASLRYDERGVGSSSGDFGEAGLYDLVSDARAAFEFLRDHGAVRSEAVGVLGHSEGALIGALLAGRDPGPAALVLAGAPAEPLDRMLILQTRRKLDDRGIRPRERDRILAEMRAFFEHVRLSDADVLTWRGRARNVRWLREHLFLEPLAVFAEVRCPALVLQGAADLQVPPVQARRVLAALGSKQKRLIVLEGLGHFLMPSPNGIEDYAETERHLDPDAIAAVGSWFDEHFRNSTELPK